MNDFITIWYKLIGRKGVYNLQSRIFHSICIMLMFGIGMSVIFNFFFGTRRLLLLMLVVCVLLSFIYYISRYKRRHLIGILSFQILSELLLIVYFFYNAGLDGPGLLLCMVSLVITITITPGKQQWLWCAVNIFVSLALLFMDLVYPNLVIHAYQHETVRHLDFAFSYVICTAIVLFVILYVRAAYHQEKRKVQRKAMALAESDATKNKLLSILAHDLKEPLSSIQNFLELLTAYEMDDPDRKRMEQELFKRTRNASQILVNVLSWTKNQMDGAHVNLKPLNLRDILIPSIQILKSMAAEKGISIREHIKAHSCVSGDPDMLQLVIRNLCTNAIKFTNSGGIITISSEEEQQQGIITVSDTGTGIPMTKQADLFSLSASSTYGTGKEKGTGLGLVLCKEFMEAQGGAIGFSSIAGEGSHFFISLKLCTDDEAASLNQFSFTDEIL